MSTLDFPGMVARYLRTPATLTTDAAGNIVLTFEPQLTPAEATILSDIRAVSKSETGLSPTDYAAVRTQMQTLRAMRQLGRNAYVNLTEAERNRQTYDCLDAICEIFLKMTRDT